MVPTMATLWIHRMNASDILVYCKNMIEAGEISHPLYEAQHVIPEEHFKITHGFYVIANTGDMQICLYPGQSMPPPHPTLGNWNPYGTVLLPAEDAIALALRPGNEDPDGFIPGESEGLWEPETRTVDELDKELEAYAAAGESLEISTP